ncbi:MAG: peptidylprolyl isomerase [Roseburia sp.]|nr:peptidylprolyl isomerase [Roseburia sp.]
MKFTDLKYALRPAVVAVAAWTFASCGGAARHGAPVRVLMRTTAGDIVLELDDRTPRHRDNFAALADEGYFDSLLFHRVIEGFMIQGGDPRTRRITGAEFDADGPETGEARYWEDIGAEIRFPELYHRRGALAAAREGDDVNPERRSSRTQFYIVWGRTFTDEGLDRTQERLTAATGGRAVMPDSVREVYRTVGGTPHLDGQYTVFGRVVEGLDVVEAIQRTPTDSLDRPLTDVRIIGARVER